MDKIKPVPIDNLHDLRHFIEPFTDEAETNGLWGIYHPQEGNRPAWIEFALSTENR